MTQTAMTEAEIHDLLAAADWPISQLRWSVVKREDHSGDPSVYVTVILPSEEDEDVDENLLLAIRDRVWDRITERVDPLELWPYVRFDVDKRTTA
jgi:hypothetical protein